MAYPRWTYFPTSAPPPAWALDFVDVRSLLQDVDSQSRIIPPEFSENGYTLFSELSEIIHGDADEIKALEKYEPCRRLILGIVNNIRNRDEFARAITSLGWNASEHSTAAGTAP